MGTMPDRKTLGLSLLLLLFFAAKAFSNPSGEEVVAGDAVVTRAGARTHIKQFSDKAIINWQDFSIAANERTQFVQPSSKSCVLNRVVGSELSSIFGSLDANGRVYLINQNGILIGKEGSVNTNGFLASALNISDQDFLHITHLRFLLG